MNREKTTYAALFKDGSYVEKNSISELTKFNPIAILRIKFHDEYITNSGYTKRLHYKFTIVDEVDKESTIRFEKFEIIDLGPETGGYMADGFKVKIMDLEVGVVYDYQTRSNGLNRFKDEIFPLMKLLNERGSWKNYITYIENAKRDEEIKTLKENLKKKDDEIIFLKDSISKLEENNTTLKNEIAGLIEKTNEK